MTTTNESAAENQLDFELRQISGRDLQLWSMGLLVMVLLGIGFLCLIAPNLLWRSSEMRLDGRFLPQLFFGFIVLVFLFNLYSHQQKTKLDQMRAEIIRKLLTNSANRDSLSDAATGLFGPAYVTQVVDREIKRAERLSSVVSFAVIRVALLDRITEAFGPAASEHLTATAINLLKHNFRGTDTICRSKRDEFLIVLPDTAAFQAEIPIARLRAAIQDWNKHSQQEYRLDVSVGIAAWNRNATGASVLQQARAAAEKQGSDMTKVRVAHPLAFREKPLRHGEVSFSVPDEPKPQSGVAMV